MRRIATLTAGCALALIAGEAPAADLGPVAPASPPAAVPLYTAPAYALVPGGRRWHGHHDWDWGNDPHHLYATYGWKQPWFYAPRQSYSQPYPPPPVIVPDW